MSEMKRGFANGRLAAFIGAAIFAGIVLLAAVPLGLNTKSLQQSVVYAQAGDSAVTRKPVRLLAPIFLDRGAKIEVSDHVDSPNGASSGSENTADAPHLTITNAVLVIDASPETRANTPASASNKAGTSQVSRLIDAVRTLKFEELAFVDALVKLRRPGGAVKTLGKINARLKPNGSPRSAVTLDGTVAYEGRVLIIKAQFDTSQDSNIALPINAEIDGTDFKVSLAGKLFTKNGLRIIADTANFQTNDLKSVLAWLHMGPINSSGLQEFQAQGRLEWHEATLAFEQSTFTLDGNAATGRLSFFFDAREPSVEGTLAFDALDLKRYLASSDGEAKRDHPASVWANLQDTVSKNELPFGLKHIDADLRLSTKALRFDGVDLGEVAGVIVAKDGHLKADLANVRLVSGTTGRANIGININGFVPSYVVRGDLSKLDLATVSQSFISAAPIDGLADLTFDLKSHGKTTDKILRAVSGQMTLSAPGGISLPIAIPKVFEKPKRGTVKPWADVGSGYTALENLTMELTAKNGMVKTKTARATLGRTTFHASGSLRLRDLLLNLVLTRLEADGEKKPDVAEEAVQLRGPLGKPEIRTLPGSNKS